MKRMVCVLLGWTLALGVAAQGSEEKEKAKKTSPGEDSEAIQILKKVDAATKAVKAVKYKGTFEPTGWMTTQAPFIEGTAVIGGGFDKFFEKFKFDIKVREEGKKVEEFVVGGNGKDYFLVDRQKKIAYRNASPSAVGFATTWTGNFGMAEFVHPTPFSDEINADTVELKGTEKVGDEECYVIHVIYVAGQGFEAMWYFSQKDFLPRRVDRIVKHLVRGDGITTLTVTDLVVDPEIDKDTFELVLPEGFQETDESPPKYRPRT